MLRTGVLLLCLAAAGRAGTFGTVVTVPGQVADLALDEARGLVYLANYTAGRIERLRTSDRTLAGAWSVAAYPSALALSRDGRYLLVAHYGNFALPGSASNLLTLLNLDTNSRQTFRLGGPPLGLAFGSDNRALVATSTDFLLFEPGTGTLRNLGTVPEIVANTLPALPGTAPVSIVAASLAASGDGNCIYGLTDSFRFFYRVGGPVVALGYVATPPQGPRVVSVARDGSYFVAGWALFLSTGRLYAQFPNPAGLLDVGSHAVDSVRGVIYSQVPENREDAGPDDPPEQPALQIVDADNLTVRERLYLPENLAGRGVLSSDGAVMYAVSESGAMVLPVGSLGSVPRLRLSAEDLLFRGSFCDRKLSYQEITISEASGGRVDFALSSTAEGIRFSPSSGTTPAKVRIYVDPTVFQNQHGTSILPVTVTSAGAVNAVPPLRVLFNNREPDQRGTILNLPGTLADILADPARDRFYVLRQDRNEVLVFQGSNHRHIATLRTSNTPIQMALTFDRSRLLVGHDNAQIISVFDLETLRAETPVFMPPGHYPRSVACSARACLAAVRNAADAIPKLDRIDLAARLATELPSLGPWENSVHEHTRLVASENGASILVAQGDGSLLIYDASADSFIVGRAGEGLNPGVYAAGAGYYVVGDTLLNAAGTALRNLGADTAGFAFWQGAGFRVSAPDSSSPGQIERVDLRDGASIRPTRLSEAPLLPTELLPLARTLAVPANGQSLVMLGPSGLTVLSQDYDAGVAAPEIQAVTNAADHSTAIAPGSLITLWGRDLNPITAASSEMPLPTALGESCLTVNGALAPIVFVSPGQVNAQLPYPVEGTAELILHTPGGASNIFPVTVSPLAPGIFRALLSDGAYVPAVFRPANGMPVTLANPVHRNEDLVIYTTGLGPTLPEVAAGQPAPSDPLAEPASPVTVDLGGTPLPLYHAALAPGMAGVYEIRVRVPGYAPKGFAVSLNVRQGEAVTTVQVRVVD